MAKKLSDINLHGDRRKAEKIYERALSGGEGSIEASKQLEKPRFKSFLKDIIDKRNAGVGRGGALVKDPNPEPEIIKEELKKTAEKLQDILGIKRSNERLRSKLEDAKRIKRPGDTPVKRKGLGLGKLAGAVKAPVFDLMGILGSLIQIGLLEWLSDVKNLKVVEDIVKILRGIFELFGKSFKSIGQGWAKLTGDDSNLIERLAGFFELITGLTLMKWLLNPKSMLKDFPRIFKAIKKMPGMIKEMMANPVKYTQEAFKKQIQKLFPQIFKKGFRAAGKRAALRVFGKHGVKMMKAITRIINKQVAKTATRLGSKGILQTTKAFLSKRANKILKRLPWLKNIGNFAGSNFVVATIINLLTGAPADEAVVGGGGFWAGSVLTGKLASPLLVAPFPGARPLYAILTIGGGIVGEEVVTSAYKGIKEFLFNSKSDDKENSNSILGPISSDVNDMINIEKSSTNSEINIEKSSTNSEVNNLSKNHTINKKIDKNNQSGFVATAIINSNTSNHIGISSGPPLNNSKENELQPAAV